MIAVIVDIVASRDMSERERRKMDREIRGILERVYERFKDFCIAVPTLTQGDSIEMLIKSWQPIVFLIHNLLMKEQEFRMSLGTGEIIIQKEIADECDGPAFWNAREALDEIKSTKYMNRSAGFRIDEGTSLEEKTAVINSLLLYTTLLGFTKIQLQHCFYYIWENKRVIEISDVTKTTKGNVSKSLSKTPCYLLEKVMTFLNT